MQITLDATSCPTFLHPGQTLMPTSVRNNSVFRSFFGNKNSLTQLSNDCTDPYDWYFNWKTWNITLDHIPVAPVHHLRQQILLRTLQAHAGMNKCQKVCCAHVELLQTVREFHTCKQEEGQSVSSHVLKMKGYIDNLERLGQPVGQNLAVSLILVSLNKDFTSFVQNFNMHGMGKTVNELHAMLKLHEESLPKKDANPALHAIRAGRVQKNQKNKPHKAGRGGKGKGKNKMGYAHNNVPFAPKPKTSPPPKKDNPAKDAICHQCGEVGHWRRNCPVYLTELMKKKKLPQGASASAETGAVSLTCDGHRATVEAIGNLSLELPIGLVIVLNIVIISRLSLESRVFGSSKGACDYCPSHSSLHASKQWSVREEKSNTARHVHHVSQTYTTKVLWDYALETAAPQSHMVPSRRLINTYEIWPRQAPKRVLLKRSTRTRHPTDRLCLYIDAEEHELGDLGEPANYRAALLDPESKKWLDAMNVEMQSMKDNDV
ncbi:zinc finger, CCHC-type containing protein [Tanacetum coccineum]